MGGSTWLILVGFGSFLACVPFGSVVFDRILSHTHAAGTAAFGIYLANAVGDSGNASVQP